MKSTDLVEFKDRLQAEIEELEKNNCNCKALACIIDTKGLPKPKHLSKKSTVSIRKNPIEQRRPDKQLSNLSFESLKKKIIFTISGYVDDAQYNRHKNIMQIIYALESGYNEFDIIRLTECYFSSETTKEYLRIAHNYIGDKPKIEQKSLFTSNKLR